MKSTILKQSIFLLVAIFFASCAKKKHVLFTKPQPMNGKTLRVFPKELRGDYFFEESGELLTIKRKVAYIAGYNIDSLWRDSMPKELIFKGEVIFDTTTNQKYYYHYDESDSSKIIAT